MGTPLIDDDGDAPADRASRVVGWVAYLLYCAMAVLGAILILLNERGAT